MLSIATAVPALHAAGVIGVWNTNVVAGRSILDEGAATLLAGNASLAGHPIPMEIALGCTHPEDRAWVFERIRIVRQTGGPFSAEFRVLTSTADVRWVLNRGALTRDGAGTMTGLGAYIDTTDSHRSPFITPTSVDQETDDPLLLAADRCLAAHAALQSGGHVDLRLRTEMLLSGIGRALARRQA
jgi:hypothetical protein